jgi:hypothetical protein
MENHLPTEKQTNETEKKQWITPEMQEINVNGGLEGGLYEAAKGDISV